MSFFLNKCSITFIHRQSFKGDISHARHHIWDEEEFPVFIKAAHSLWPQHGAKHTSLSYMNWCMNNSLPTQSQPTSNKLIVKLHREYTRTKKNIFWYKTRFNTVERRLKIGATKSCNTIHETPPIYFEVHLFYLAWLAQRRCHSHDFCNNTIQVHMSQKSSWSERE